MRIAAITGGHSFDEDAFRDLLRSLPAEVDWWKQPEAQESFNAEGLTGFDASLHYDMPGARPTPSLPPQPMLEDWATLIDRGHGFVVLHHAIASWPTWDTWAELVGGRYLYRPGPVRGEIWPDSGYRENVAQHLAPIDPSHPVLAGLEGGLDLVDETYVCAVFEADVEPLLVTDADRTAAAHRSTVAAVDGLETTSWNHPDSPPLATWARTVGRSRMVYIQPGDTAVTLGDPAYRRLVANALSWVTDPSR